MRRVLLVIDDHDLTRAYSEALESENTAIARSEDATLALQDALDFAPHLIIIDATFSAASGYDLLAILRHTPETAHVGIILLDSLVDPHRHARARELGAHLIAVKSLATVNATATQAHRLLDTITAP